MLLKQRFVHSSEQENKKMIWILPENQNIYQRIISYKETCLAYTDTNCSLFKYIRTVHLRRVL
jgi:hypothetical protein